MTIYIGNFDTQWNEEQVKQLFEPYGQVASATIAMDLFTDRSRGFAYVEMPNESEAAAAIAALDKKEQDGRQLTVHTAPPQKEQKGSYKVGNGGVNPYRFRKN